MTLTKAHIAEHLLEENDIPSKGDADQLVNLFFEEICSKLENGEEIKLSSFGNFKLREKNARPGRNPKTGEEHVVSARRVVSFRAGHKLKKRVESIDVEEQED